MVPEINSRTGIEYYAGSAENIRMICTVLKIDGGRLSQITPDKVHEYMDMVEQAIDGYLEEHYFTPIRPYNVYMPNNTTVKQFPGRLRRIAQYWSAGLLIMSQFQQIEPNLSDSANAYIEDSKKELFQITLFNQRIPGQVYKSGWGRTCPPTLQPGRQPERDF